MNQMIERVARALALNTGSRFLRPGQSVASNEMGWTWDGEYLERYVNAHWEEHINSATFVIDAMREPTEGMLASVVEHGVVRNEAATSLWRRMIDGALK